MIQSLPPANEVWGKTMFLQVFVCLGVCIREGGGLHPEGSTLEGLHPGVSASRGVSLHPGVGLSREICIGGWADPPPGLHPRVVVADPPPN